MTYRKTDRNTDLQTRHLNAFAHACLQAYLKCPPGACAHDLLHDYLPYELVKFNKNFNINRWQMAINGEIETLT